MAPAAYEQIRGVWIRAHERLGVAEPIGELPDSLPVDPTSGALESTLAARQDRTADYQLIVRRHHDVVNLSMVFGAPVDTEERRLRLGLASAPGWAQFDRAWRTLTEAGTDAWLGVALLFQAKTADSEDVPTIASAVRAALPEGPADQDWWWRGRENAQGFSEFEISTRAGARHRRLAIVTTPARDAQLSAWTWTRGTPELTPLGRYLLHAAKVRFMAAVRGDAEGLSRLRDRLAVGVSEVQAALENFHEPWDAARGLLPARAEAADSIAQLAAMRRSVQIAQANMAALAPTQFESDQRLAAWLVQQLDDDLTYLTTAQRAADETVNLLPRPTSEQSVSPATAIHATPPRPRAPVPEAPTSTPAAVPGQEPVMRFGFGFDAVSFSGRSAAGKLELQARMTAITEGYLADLGLSFTDVDFQPEGDGAKLFLPPELRVDRVLAELIRSWPARLAADNRDHGDTLRLRLAAVFGPVSKGPLSFSHSTVIELGRLLDSRPLRAAVKAQPDVPLVLAVSSVLYQFTVENGYPDLVPAQFTRVMVTVKEYRREAWLWLPSSYVDECAVSSA